MKAIKVVQTNICYKDDRGTVTTYSDSLNEANLFMDNLVTQINSGEVECFNSAWMIEGVWIDLADYKISPIKEVKI